MPATATVAHSTAAFVASTVRRRGTAASVARIRPVPYSPPTIPTASTVTTTWPSHTPARLSFVVSSKHPAGVGQCEVSTVAVAAAPAATVSTAVAATSHALAGSVRSLVHSACSARITRPAGSSRHAAIASAAAAYAHSTPNPAHGAIAVS